MYKDDVIRV